MMPTRGNGLAAGSNRNAICKNSVKTTIASTEVTIPTPDVSTLPLP
jgi:hypothetical protein